MTPTVATSYVLRNLILALKSRSAGASSQAR